MANVRVTGRGRRRALGGHPWIYKDDVVEAAGVGPGALVAVEAPDRKILGWALFSDASKIALRFVRMGEEQPNRAFWIELVRRAVAARASNGLLAEGGAARLIAGDADGLPGLVVDKYGDRLVVQSGCQGSDAMRDFLLEILDTELAGRGIKIAAVLDRSDASVRRHEQLESRVEWLRGSEADAKVVVREAGDSFESASNGGSAMGVSEAICSNDSMASGDVLEFEVDLLGGHKTGHYLDQRFNRVRTAELCRDYGRHGFGRVIEPRVLDVFSYDGLFGIRCALAGAGEVLCLDQAAAAGRRLADHVERAGVGDRVRFERVDAMRNLGERVKAGERWDVVVLDPPAFARSRREVGGAKRGYGELFRRGFQLTERGGFVVAASCSFNMGAVDFHEVLVKSAKDAGVRATLMHIDGPSPDHPRRLDLPESDYLKCAFLRVEPLP